MEIRVNIKTEGVRQLLDAAGPRADVALARALNRTGGPVATAAKRNIRKVLGAKPHPYAKKPLGDMLRSRTRIYKASPGNLSFALSGFGKGLPLIYYAPKESPTGATVNWLGARKKVDRSFYLSGKFPGRKRSGISGWVSQRQKPGRWKLYRPNGPGVPEAMEQAAVARAWEADARARLPAHLLSALQAVLRGY